MASATRRRWHRRFAMIVGRRGHERSATFRVLFSDGSRGFGDGNARRARARARGRWNVRVRGKGGGRRHACRVRENIRRITARWLARVSSARASRVRTVTAASTASAVTAAVACHRATREGRAGLDEPGPTPPQRVELDAIGPAPAATQGTRAVPSPTRRPARAHDAKTPPDGYGVGCSSRGLRAVRGRGDAPSWLAPRRCGDARGRLFQLQPSRRHNVGASRASPASGKSRVMTNVTSGRLLDD